MGRHVVMLRFWKTPKSSRSPSYCTDVNPNITADPALINSLWSCVSISRTQFDLHYRFAIKRFALYLQSTQRLHQALHESRSALQDSLIIRLPVNRDREEAARHEQLWKFTAFLQPLLTEAARCDRHWYDANGQETASFERAVCYADDATPANAVKLCFMLPQFLHPISADWLLCDDQRCLQLLYGQHTANQPSPPSSTPPTEAPDPSVAAEHPQATPSLTPLYDAFVSFIADHTYQHDGHAYIRSPDIVKRFLKTQHGAPSTGEFQALLQQHGFTPRTLKVGSKNRHFFQLPETL